MLAGRFFVRVELGGVCFFVRVELGGVCTGRVVSSMAIDGTLES